jgi:hypothetical protein
MAGIILRILNKIGIQWPKELTVLLRRAMMWMNILEYQSQKENFPSNLVEKQL